MQPFRRGRFRGVRSRAGGRLAASFLVFVQEVLEQVVTAFGQDGFGVELHALDGQRLVADAHDFAVVGPRGDVEAVGQRLALDGQRMVTGAGQRVGQALEDADILVVHRRNLTVHQLLGMHDPAAEGLADRLVAEADAEQRNLAGEFADRRPRNAGLGRGAGAGRNDQIVGLEAGNVGDGDSVVAVNLHRLPQFLSLIHI